MSKQQNVTRRIVSPRSELGPLGTDPRGFGVFSEVDPPETIEVDHPRVVLYDANENPLTRKIGFK